MTESSDRTETAIPPLPAATGTEALALFLDFDGTLVEIAPAPHAVKLDRRVAPALESVRSALGGALALVSGRPIVFLDEMMSPHRFDAAGLHGAQIRLGDEITQIDGAPEGMTAAVRDMVRFANSHIGVIVEDKRASVALHWRLAPQLADEALALMRSLAERIGPGIRLQEGKSVAELVPASASKGAAIAQMMATGAYRGRRPVFIGDDITDEAGFAAVNEMGGLSIRIGGGDTCAGHRIASPTALRAILFAAADAGSLTTADLTRA